MDDENYGPSIDDILDLTDSEETSSSNNEVFEPQQLLVLELHDLKRDGPTSENVTPEAKVKKHKKKKKAQPAANRSHTSVSSDSISDAGSITPTIDELRKEEFYDAHESYHALPENQVSNSVTAAALVQARSEHGQNPKVVQAQASLQLNSANARVPSSTVSKPFTRPG